MRGVHLRMNEAGMPVDAIHALTLAWLENRNVGTIASVDQLGWLFAQFSWHTGRRWVGRRSRCAGAARSNRRPMVRTRCRFARWR